MPSKVRKGDDGYEAKLLRDRLTEENRKAKALAEVEGPEPGTYRTETGVTLAAAGFAELYTMRRQMGPIDGWFSSGD